jgi:exodeoxyribonuclease (lambda-induced)
MADQGTPAWIKARIGHLTASRMEDAMNYVQDGKAKKGEEQKYKSSAARTQYMGEVVAERITNLATDHYVTPEMKWGTEYEPFARAKYEIRNGVSVQQVGFIEHPKLAFFGGSPDGIVGFRKVLEIKCPTTTTFLKWRREGVVPEKHRPQMLANMLCTGLTEGVFVAYDPRIQVGDTYFQVEYVPTDEELYKVWMEAEKFLREVDELFDLSIGYLK